MKLFRPLLQFFTIILLLFNGLQILCAQGSGTLSTNETTAAQLFFSGNMHEAAKHYTELLRVDSMHYDFNVYAGLAFLNANLSKSQAIVHLTRALKKPKADQYIHFYLGKAYMLNYQFDEAIDEFNAFVKCNLKQDKSDLPVERYLEMCDNAKLLISLRNDVTLDNIGSEINSEFPDYNAYITADEHTLYFSSKQAQNSGSEQDIDGYKFADIYTSDFVDGKWLKAKKMQPPVNSTLIEDVVGVTADGETLILYCNNDKGFDDLFFSKKEKKQFTRPEMLSLTVNSEQGEEAGMISPDGQWIFFSSNRPGGYGGYDIYFSRRLPNGEWSNPKNAGPNINTKYHDSYPYIAPDGVTFFFSSQGHNSMGGFDLFKSSWDAENQFFAIPENLAFPINTPDDNKTISVTKSGRYAYIADYRGNSTGDLDVYKVTFQEVPAPYYVIQGDVAEVDSVTLMANLNSYKVVIREAGTKKQVGVYRPNLHNGSFTFILQPGYYLIDRYLNDSLLGSDEYQIEDREPAEEKKMVSLLFR